MVLLRLARVPLPKNVGSRLIAVRDGVPPPRRERVPRRLSRRIPVEPRKHPRLPFQELPRMTSFDLLEVSRLLEPPAGLSEDVSSFEVELTAVEGRVEVQLRSG